MNASNKSHLHGYIVSLKDDHEDKFTYAFNCMAEDFDHAEEQALNAYPNAIITNMTRLGD